MTAPSGSPRSPEPPAVDPAARSRAVRPVLLEGDMLAGRYRLVRAIPAAGVHGGDGPAVLWLAQDQVLARPVAAKLLPAVGKRGASAARPFLAAAAASGGLSHPGLARVYDAAVEQFPSERAGRAAGEIDVAYVISEWVDGPGLLEQLTEEGPYDAADAVAVTEALAEALAAAHAQGLVHGRVHPGNVLLTRTGAVKLTDLGVSTALPQHAVPALRADDPWGPAADVRDLAAITYAALTARWPTTATPQPSGGLPAAPAGRDGNRPRGRLASPRQVRAGVPRALDAVVVRALDPVRAAQPPDLTSTTGLMAALDGAVRADTPRAASGPAAPHPPRVPPWARRLLPSVVVLALLVVLGFSAYAKGLSVGTIEAPEERPPVLAGPTGSTAAATAVRIPLGALAVRDFDPPPGDGSERRGEVPNAYDDDPSTAWRTERYRGESFGGIKTGVGLLVDLGAPTALTRVELSLETAGTVVELRVGDTEAAEATGYRLVASGRSTDAPLALTLPAGTRPRYCLVWVTGLPRVPDGFVAGVRELRLLR